MNEYTPTQTGPPVHVQLARLAFCLETVHLLLRQDEYVQANQELAAAKKLVSLLQGSV